MNPTPLTADLHKAYAKYFTHAADEGQSAQSFNLRELLYSIYRFLNFPGWWITGIAAEKTSRARMFIKGGNGGRLLDVGCGDGKFLYSMQQKGWIVDGIDFDSKAIQSAKIRYGLDLRHGDLTQAALPGSTFDVVTMSHVVEHLPEPAQVLAEIRRLLKPAGRLILTTPNVKSLGSQKFGSAWFGLDAPRHLNLFTPNALAKLAGQAGFQQVTTHSSSASADVFFGASFTLQDFQGHRMGHQPTPNLTRTFKAACWQYREHFALREDPECGEELVAICTKT